MTVNILNVPNNDDHFDCYNDWLIGEYAEKFITGNGKPYTHIDVEGEIIQCEICVNDKGHLVGVAIGETIIQE